VKSVDIFSFIIYNILDVHILSFRTSSILLRVICINYKIKAYKDSIRNKRVSVCGIGISNIPLIDFLLSAGCKVTARDIKERESLGDIATELEEKGIRLVCGKGYLDDIDDDIVFRTPGLRYDTKGLTEARERGSTVTSEMQVFFELCPCTKIGITGSDGKTTTTTLIAEMLKAEGKTVWLGGNIGTPLLQHLDAMKPSDFAVVELSSFQLHTMTTCPEIAVITNLSPNHLDYHTDYSEYIDAKKNIFRHSDSLTLVTNGGNAITEDLAKEYEGNKIIFGKAVEGVASEHIFTQNGAIFFGSEKILDVADIRLPGTHNVENYMAAIGAVHSFVSNEAITRVAREFNGVEHRLEFVAIKNGVKYYNSSIDSSPSRTAAALSAFSEKNLVVICGGYDKNLDYAPLAPVMAEKAKAVVLTGSCAQKIKKALLESRVFLASNTKIIEEEGFEEAVKKASLTAESGDCVLLSPAAASFDRFKNFEARGRLFKEIVSNLN